MVIADSLKADMSNSRPTGPIRPMMGLDLAHWAALEMARGQPLLFQPWPSPAQPSQALRLGVRTGGGVRMEAGSAWQQLQLVGPLAVHWPAQRRWVQALGPLGQHFKWQAEAEVRGEGGMWSGSSDPLGGHPPAPSQMVGPQRGSLVKLLLPCCGPCPLIGLVLCG